MSLMTGDSRPGDMSRNVSHETAPASPAPSGPRLPLGAVRLRLGAVLSHGTLLDGGWWPRSASPVAELPGLILAIEDRCGRVTRIMLGPAGRDSQPRRLAAAGRVVKIGWFPGQPAGLLTTFCGSSRIDLLVVPPGTAETDARAAKEPAVGDCKLAGHRSRSAPAHQGGGAGWGSSAGLVCEGPCTGGAASLTLAWRAVTASGVTLKTVRSWVTVTGPV